MDEATLSADAAYLTDLLMDLDTEKRARTELMRISVERSPEYTQALANLTVARFTNILLNNASMQSVGLHTRSLASFIFTARRLILGIHPPT